MPHETSPRRNRAAVLVEPRQLVLQETPLVPLNPADAQIRVHAAGVCGTDLAIHDGHYPVPLPLVLGHEWVGTVEAVGDGKDEGWVGRRVVGEINNHCIARRLARPCEACAKGLPNHCKDRSVAGIIEHSGAFAERIVCPTDNLRHIPDEMPNEAAVFIEPLAAAIQTFAMTPVHANDTVAILGCGRLGLLVAVVAQAFKARVLAFSHNAVGVERAAFFGVSAQPCTYDLDTIESVRSATNGLGADIVVEATGTPEGLSVALNCVRPRGTVALKSTPGRPVERFDLTRVVVDEICLQGSRCGVFADAISFWERYRPPLERMIVAEFPLERITEAIDQAHQPGKVLVRC